MQALAIILLCTASAVAYGILHNNVTARVCVEYFTIGHPALFDTDAPALLAPRLGRDPHVVGRTDLRRPPRTRVPRRRAAEGARM